MKKNYKSITFSLKKIFRIMKVVIILLWMASFTMRAVDVYSQNANIHIRDYQDITIEKFIQEVESQTNYLFVYSKSEINTDERVSLTAEETSVKSALDRIASHSQLAYRYDNDYIVLTKRELAIFEPTVQQQNTITGTVTDIDGEPLPGVSVLIKGTTQGTATDANGAYSLPVHDENATLVFSFIGFVTQELPTGNRRMINVTLVDNTHQLEEVVVIGFGIQKKVNLTGAVGTVSATDLQNRPVQNITQALQGLVPGLNIQNTSGFLDHTPGLNIRGTGNLGTGSSSAPLVLVDGVENDLKFINPHDVENISVLKDAAASSIYGSRAPFGVILITTKKGATGQTKVNYNNNFRWGAPTTLPKMMDSYTMITFMWDAADNAGIGRFGQEERLQRVKDYMNGVITTVSIPDRNNPLVWANGNEFGNANADWHDVVYKKWAFSQDHNFSASGGTDKFNYYMSLGYVDQNGLLKVADDSYRRYSATGTIDAKMTDWLKLRYTTRFIRSDYNRPTDLAQNMYRDLGRQTWPFLPVYDDNGYYYSANSPILPLVEGGKTNAQNDHLNQHVSVNIDPVKNWVTTLEFNYNTKTYAAHAVSLPTYWHNVAGDPYKRREESWVSDSGNKTNFLNVNVFTSYQFDLFQNHHFTVMAGGQLESFKYNNYGLSRVGVMVGDLAVIDLTTGFNPNGTAAVPAINGSASAWSTAGYFGRFNYDYQGRYLLEANLRYDGSSRFRGDQRWNLFPSFSAGWNMAREDFWDDWKNAVGMLKLRASWGSLGNQNTDSYYPTYQTMPISINAGSWLQDGKRPNTASSPALISTSLTWEKIQSWDAGVDVGALNSRLTASFDYYVRKTLNMVGPAMELPNILGKAVPRMNNTDLKTYGFELELAWQDRLSNDLSYGVRFLLSDYQAEVTRYPNATNSLSTYIAGQKLYNIWGYETIGIAKSDEEMQAYLASLPNGGQNAIGSNWRAGDIMYKDLNNDGRINSGSNTLDDPGDQKIIGNTTSRYQFGLDLHASWKGFDARVFFQGVGKRDYWTRTNMFFGGYNGGIYDMIGLQLHTDYFRLNPSNDMPANLDAYYPRPIMSTTKNMQPQTRFLQNAAYIRLKNLSLGYNLPRQVTTKFFVAQMRLFVTGENLWTGTKMASMFDPESIGGLEGTSGDGYPLQKTWSFGLNITL